MAHRGQISKEVDSSGHYWTADGFTFVGDAKDCLHGYQASVDRNDGAKYRGPGYDKASRDKRAKERQQAELEEWNTWK